MEVAMLNDAGRGLTLSAILLVVSPLSAQQLAVYTDNTSNGTLLKLDFGAGTSQIVSSDTRKNLQGLTVRDDGPGGAHIIVCQQRGGNILFYQNAQGAGSVITNTIKLPDGPSLDPAGNLYVVSTGSKLVASQVWRIPIGGGGVGGYGTPAAIDLDAPSDLLEDTRVVPATAGELLAGDLLVVSRTPARVIRYRYEEGTWERLTSFIEIGGGVQPTGIAFTSGGEILVSTLKGVIMRFDMNGDRISPDFVSGLGSGRFKLAVGFEGGSEYAFVASRSGGKVVRFKIVGGVGTAPASVTAGLSLPNGVAITSGLSVPTPVGSLVTVNPAPEVEITFDSITSPGFTSANVVDFVDNRGSGEGCADQNLKDFFPAGALKDSLPDVTVPCYFRGFKKAGAMGESDPEYFVLAIIDTTAAYAGTARAHFQEQLRLGWAPVCDHSLVNDPTDEPRTFYGPERPKGEPSIEEDRTFAGTCPFSLIGGECPVFSDVSSECGSNVARGYNFSLYLTGRDTRSVPEIVEYKIAHMEQALGGTLDGLVTDSGTLAYLLEELGEARYHYEKFLGGPVDAAWQQDHASNELGDVIKRVQNNPTHFNNSSRNVAGEIVARALSAKFLVCHGSADYDNCYYQAIDCSIAVCH
jgi:hypothetical protein